MCYFFVLTIIIIIILSFFIAFVSRIRINLAQIWNSFSSFSLNLIWGGFYFVIFSSVPNIVFFREFCTISKKRRSKYRWNERLIEVIIVVIIIIFFKLSFVLKLRINHLNKRNNKNIILYSINRWKYFVFTKWNY